MACSVEDNLAMTIELGTRGKEATGGGTEPQPPALLLPSRKSRGGSTYRCRYRKEWRAHLGRNIGLGPWAWGPCKWSGGCGGPIPHLPLSTTLWAALSSDGEGMGPEGQMEDKAQPSPLAPPDCPLPRVYMKSSGATNSLAWVGDVRLVTSSSEPQSQRLFPTWMPQGSGPGGLVCLGHHCPPTVVT